MSELFIHMQPEAFHGFLSVFNQIYEGGEVFCYLEGYKGETIKPEELIEAMEQSNYSIFGVAARLPEQVKKMNLEIIEEDGDHFLGFNFAAFVGLPANNPIAELKEFKNLMEWLKEEAINNHPAHIYLTIDRSPRQVQTRIISDSKELEARLQTKFDEKIANSPVLTAWRKIQEEGFKLDNPQCVYLTARMNMMELLDMTQQMELMQKNVDKNQQGDEKKFKGFFL